jgi:heme/copper-type cytochrome/quinol oxidase subunit 2
MSRSTDDAAITLQPGVSGELAYTFDQPGTYEVGCHQPGHYAAGMKIDVIVEWAASRGRWCDLTVDNIPPRGTIGA